MNSGTSTNGGPQKLKGQTTLLELTQQDKMLILEAITLITSVSCYEDDYDTNLGAAVDRAKAALQGQEFVS